MKKWKIVTDSGSDIRTLDIDSDKVGFEYVPLMFTIDNEVYHDDESLNLALFQEKLNNTKLPSSSACPAPNGYADAFRGAENVICFTISGALSGSFNSASLGKDLLLEEDNSLNIHIFDSRTAGSEMNLLVRKAAELAEQGVDFDELVTEITNYHKRTNVAFLLQSVDNLVKNGRVKKLVGQMVGLLNIRIIGNRSDEGTIQLAHKSRGMKRALKTLLDEITDQGYKGGKIEISHAFNLEGANKVKEMILNQFSNAEIRIVEMSALCTYYAEEHGIIVGYEQA